METRLSGGDIALEPPTDDGEESFAPIAYLADDAAGADQRRWKRKQSRLAGRATASRWRSTTLDARSRRIVEARWLRSTTTARAADAARPGGRVRRVSAERIRQIEVAAMKKMRKALARRRYAHARLLLTTSGARLRAPSFFRRDASDSSASGRARMRSAPLRRSARTGAAAPAGRTHSCRRCGPSCSCPASCPAPSA